MRLFLLPISTRRTLIYCDKNTIQKASSVPGQKPPILDRITTKAANTWSNFEKAPSGWKKQLTTYGNMVLRRIPYEEWGLKSIPALGEKRRKEIEAVFGKESGKGTGGVGEGEKEIKTVEVLFPGQYLKESKILDILKQLATERQGLHKKRMIWSLVAAPLTAPFALVPIVPNIPFFYLLFRGWSHWRALNGAKHLSFLTTYPSILNSTPSPKLDNLYTLGLLHSSREKSRIAPPPSSDQIKHVAEDIEIKGNSGQKEVMLLQRWNGKLLAEEFGLPEMEVEIERAVEQVENGIKKAEEEEKEKAKEGAMKAVEEESKKKI